MRCNPVTPEMITRAKNEGLYIVQICVTGQYLPSKDGGTAITGAFSKQAARELRDFMRRWYKKNSE
jgi:hypothetical protein